MDQKLVALEANTKKLLSEPTNTEATEFLLKEEPEMETLRATVEDARGLLANEDHKKKVKKRIGDMTVHWRKRRKICNDFFLVMEDNQDSFSKKKTLKGEGPIYCEGDEYIVSQAKEMAAMSKGIAKKPLLGRRNAPIKKAAPKSLADPNFIGVLLGGGGVERVFLDN